MPAGDASGATDPDVGGVDAAKNIQTGFFAGLNEEGGVAHVVFDEGADLGFAFIGVEGGGAALDNVTGTIEFGAVAAAPEGMDGVGGAVFFTAHEGFGDDDEGAANAGESTVFGEAAELDGAVAGTFDFVDGAGDRGVLNEGFVGGVVEQDGFTFESVGDPGFELSAGGGGTGGVVGVAEIDEIDGLVGDFGNEAVFGVALEIDQAFVGTVFIGIAGIADHHVGVDVDGVDGISDGDFVAGSEDVQDVAGVALGAVGDEDFVGVDVEAAGFEIVVGDGVAEEVVALLGAITFEGFGNALFVDGIVHGIADGFGEGFGDITNAASDEAFGTLGVGFIEDFDATGDFREEVSGFQLEVVFVDVGHGVGGMMARCGVDARFCLEELRCFVVRKSQFFGAGSGLCASVLALWLGMQSAFGLFPSWLKQTPIF